VRIDGAAVKAAGAVLWHASPDDGLRVALVHRPRYDDWSLPKGKAEPGESAPITAAREVLEETGFDCTIGRALTTVSYSEGGRSKTVEYFAACRLDGSFDANKEVDRLEWLPLPVARSKMSYEFDRAVLDTFSLERPDLAGVLLVRHGRAGHRESYDGDDVHRPLDSKGRKQAQALVGELMPFRPAGIHSAPLERCAATVAPLAERLGIDVVMEPLLAEDAYRDDPAAARRRLVELADLPGRTVAACSQGGVIPGVVKSLAGLSGFVVPKTGTPKGAFWYLAFDGRRLVQADQYPTPPV
jgi:8-oxo-dGTP pyrophosphatase MutT (NUDIX family)/phosphohistidine phosphatase SixA